MPDVSKIQVPQTTTPLTKFVRTAEGILVIFFNVVLLIVPIVTTFSATKAAAYAGILDTVVVISRSGLKAVASLAGSSGVQPTFPVGTPPELAVLSAMEDTGGPEPILTEPPQSGVTPDPGVPDDSDAPAPTPPAAPASGTSRRRN